MRPAAHSGRLTPYLLLAPATILFAIFMFYPLLYTLYLSFFDWNMTRPTKEFVAFDNYIAVFTDPNFGKIMGNTALYILLLLLFDFAAPYVFSFILSFVVQKGKNFYKSSIFLPSVISLVVGTMIFVWLLNPISGPVSAVAKALGVTIPIWSNTQGLVIVVLSIITSWKIFGYNFIVVMAGVSSVPLEVVEAARLDDVPNWRIFLNIVVPMSSSTGIYVLILSIVTGMQQIFTPINMVTQGGPDYASTNLIYAVYDQAFGFFKTGTASAYAILMMLLFGFLLFLEFKFVEKSVYYEN
nr:MULTISPECIES: sugar ABC transporter permease [environmental samples]